MSVFNVTASTSVVLINTASGAGTYTVNFPNLSSIGRIITVRDNDGYASTGNSIVLNPVQGASFGSVLGSPTINQPFGFVTMNSLANGIYNVLNTFAFPAGQAAANISNLNAEVVTVLSTIQFVDQTDATLDTLYVSSSQLIFNNDYVGDVTTSDLQSTVAGLGTAGYLSSFSWSFVLPPLWVAVGTSNTSSIQWSTDQLTWSNARGAGGFKKQGWGAAWYGGTYVAVGDDGDGLNTPSYGYNKYSFDGSNWNNSVTPQLSTSLERYGALYANGLFHSVGKGGQTGGSNSILWSEDGRSWYPSQGTPFSGASSYARGIAYGNGVWVCAGVTSVDINSLLWSIDGSNWNPANTVLWSGVGDITDVAFAGNRFLALCKNGTGTSSNVCFSIDGSNWLAYGVGTNGNFGNTMYRVAGDGSERWVLTTSQVGTPVYYSIDDGATWAASPTFSGLVTAADSKSYWDGLKWWVGLTTGGGSGLAQSVHYSTDAENWVPVSSTQFTGGADAYGFVSSDGFSNIGFLLTSTVIGLETNFSTSNLNVSSISSGFITAHSVLADTMTISSLFVNVFTVSTTIEEVAVNSTIIVNKGYINNLSTNYVSANTMFISSLGINTANPQYVLDVNGLAWMRSTLYIGSNVHNNQIRFYGTTDDNPGSFTHTVIGERLYSGTQRSELLLFKGNDGATVDGPDRVRVLATGGFQVDCAPDLTVWPQGGSPPNPTFSNCLAVSGSNGFVGIGTSTPSVALDVNGNLSNAIKMRLYRPASNQTFGVGTLYTLQNSAGIDCNYASIYGGISTNTAGSEQGYISLNTLYTGNPIEDSGASYSNTMILTGTTVGINLLNGTYPNYNFQVGGTALFNATGGKQIGIGVPAVSDGGVIAWDTIDPGEGNLEISAGKTGGSTKGYINFYTNVASGTSPTTANKVMTITNTNVGIGTSNPSYTLDVNGNTNINGNLTVSGSLNSGVVGSIIMFGGATAPSGWLLCNGTSYLIATYPVLYGIIGTTYGVGSNQFQVPNLQQRFPIGAGGGYSLGGTGGTSTITLTSNQMPSHSHTATDSGHTHGFSLTLISGNSGGDPGSAQWGGNNDFGSYTASGTTVSSTANITVASAGGGTSIDISNPYTVINYIIKT